MQIVQILSAAKTHWFDFFLNKKGNILDLFNYDTTIDCPKPNLRVIVKIIKNNSNYMIKNAIWISDCIVDSNWSTFI